MASRAARMNSLTASAADPGAVSLADRTHQPGADDHPVGDPADRRRLLRGADAETDRGRHRCVGAHRGDELGEAGGQLVALAGHPGVGDHVDETLGSLADPAAALVRRRRSHQWHQRDAGGAQLLADLVQPPPRADPGGSRPRRRRRRAGARTRRHPGRAPCSRTPSAAPGAARQPARRSTARSRASPRRPAPGWPPRGSPARRPAGRRTARPARSGRPRPRA